MSTGPIGPMKSWLDRLLEMAIGLVAVGLLLNWAWQLLKPLVPIVIVGTGLLAIARWLFVRHQQW